MSRKEFGGRGPRGGKRQGGGPGKPGKAQGPAPSARGEPPRAAWAARPDFSESVAGEEDPGASLDLARPLAPRSKPDLRGLPGGAEKGAALDAASALHAEPWAKRREWDVALGAGSAADLEAANDPLMEDPPGRA